MCEDVLQGVETGLGDLMNGKASSVKYVFGAADAPVLEKAPGFGLKVSMERSCKQFASPSKVEGFSGRIRVLGAQQLI